VPRACGSKRVGTGGGVGDEQAARRRELGAFLRAQRQAHRLSLRRLAEVSGISNPYLSQIERGLRKPSAEILRLIGEALGIPIEHLYVMAGILPPRFDAQPAADLPERIRSEPSLTEDQKEALVGLYLKFRREGRGEVSPAG
jgi:transcriptional regulator with XRE-family HTH domain